MLEGFPHEWGGGGGEEGKEKSMGYKKCTNLA